MKKARHGAENQMAKKQRAYQRRKSMAKAAWQYRKPLCSSSVAWRNGIKIIKASSGNNGMKERKRQQQISSENRKRIIEKYHRSIIISIKKAEKYNHRIIKAWHQIKTANKEKRGSKSWHGGMAYVKKHKHQQYGMKDSSKNNAESGNSINRNESENDASAWRNNHRISIWRSVA